MSQDTVERRVRMLAEERVINEHGAWTQTIERAVSLALDAVFEHCAVKLKEPSQFTAQTEGAAQ